MDYYLVLVFVAAHFVATIGWSNLDLISAVYGAAAIQNCSLTAMMMAWIFFGPGALGRIDMPATQG